MNDQAAQRNTIHKLVYCAMFTTLIAAGAFIKVPIPVIPFTLQTFFVILSGALLGSKWGAISAGLYMMLGLIGLPIFTQGGGFWYVAKPTFGYIIGFCVGSYITGKIMETVTLEKLSHKRILFANFVGLLAIYLIGMVYFYFLSQFVLHTPITPWALFISCFVMVFPGDACLCVLAAVLTKRLKRLM